jgi:Ca2+-binding EF-hand superfamily protein
VSDNLSLVRASKKTIKINLTEEINMKLLPFILVLLLGSGAVHAQESSLDKEIDQRFALADKNKDGKLTLAEAKEGMPRVASNFSRIDVQNKGYVTLAEIKAMANR